MRTRNLLAVIVLAALARQTAEGSGIVVDQFGYRTDARKIAIARDPQVGFDSAEAYVPGPLWALVDSVTKDTVLTGSFAPWKSGSTDASSGDKAWRLDFSAWKREGTYTIVDASNGVVSPPLRIAADPYREVLRQVLRSFYYQRSGQDKSLPFAEAGWTDVASHLKNGQDSESRLYTATTDPTTQLDLRGGWTDGEGNSKTVRFASIAVVDLLKAYEERRSAWGDDAGIPESSNGVPDILDEALWGLRWLARMQQPDGSCLSLVQSATPLAGQAPSSATERTVHAPANTTSTLHCASTLALGASVLGVHSASFGPFADSLEEKALAAWRWTIAYPDSVFHNRSPSNGSANLGSQDQEVAPPQRTEIRLEAAAHLHRATGDTLFRHVADSLVKLSSPFLAPYASPYTARVQTALASYAGQEGVLPEVSSAIRLRLESVYTKESGHYLGAAASDRDPYLASHESYGYQSNVFKVLSAQNLLDLARLNPPGHDSSRTMSIAEEYLHFFHGRNPLGLSYLSNMRRFGAEASIGQIYHAWFREGTSWDQVGVSAYGPPPGFLVFGPNPNYGLDACCPSSCASPENNARCDLASMTPPLKQPPQKSYLDFNDQWPRNSWALSGVALHAQSAYLRLLSAFVAIPSSSIPVGVATIPRRFPSLAASRLPQGVLVRFQAGVPERVESRLMDLRGRVLSVGIRHLDGILFPDVPRSTSVAVLEARGVAESPRRLVVLPD
jgi:endoglucanase